MLAKQVIHTMIMHKYIYQVPNRHFKKRSLDLPVNLEKKIQKTSKQPFEKCLFFH